jgi:hypothetical protein
MIDIINIKLRPPFLKGDSVAMQLASRYTLLPLSSTGTRALGH